MYVHVCVYMHVCTKIFMHIYLQKQLNKISLIMIIKTMRRLVIN